MRMLFSLLVPLFLTLTSMTDLTATARSIAQPVQNKPVLALYYNPSCFYCKKVTQYLNSIHKTVPLKNVAQDRKAKEELSRIGGRMQVPCLFIDGKPLYDSNAIIQWLSEHQEILEQAQ